MRLLAATLESLREFYAALVDGDTYGDPLEVSQQIEKIEDLLNGIRRVRE